LSQLLSGTNKVVNALGLRTKAFIAGSVQKRQTPQLKPIIGFNKYYIESDCHNDIIQYCFLIQSQVKVGSFIDRVLTIIILRLDKDVRREIL
jgi:hypothetical protein